MDDYLKEVSYLRWSSEDPWKSEDPYLCPRNLLSELHSLLSRTNLSYVSTQQELLQQLSTAHWTVTNADELESGSAANPFKFGDSNTRQAQKHAMHHSLITSGGATASLADAKQLLTV
jgi:hypothetical protein